MLLDGGTKCTSDVFAVPANQHLVLSGYVRKSDGVDEIATVTVESVAPQQQTLFEIDLQGTRDTWVPFSRSFDSGDVPTKCRVVITAVGTGFKRCFDSLLLVSK